MRTSALAVGVGVSDETALEARLNQIAERMVHDAVAKGGGADLASLGFVNIEMRVGARRVIKAQQVRLQFQQAVGQAVLESGDIVGAAFALGGLTVGAQQVRPELFPILLFPHIPTCYMSAGHHRRQFRRQ